MLVLFLPLLTGGFQGSYLCASSSGMNNHGSPGAEAVGACCDCLASLPLSGQMGQAEVVLFLSNPSTKVARVVMKKAASPTFTLMAGCCL